ncbi:MAG: phosphatidate cytidylyltransferase, partial [Bacteroides sp.]
MKSNFILRALTGIVFVVVLAGSILIGPYTFALLFTLICALSVNEFSQLINRSGEARVPATLTGLCGAFLVLGLWGFCTNSAGSCILLPYPTLLLYLIIRELYLKQPNPVANWAYSMMSQLYVALPFALLNVLAFHTNRLTGEVTYNPVLPLSIFIFLWLSDTGAYCVGSLIGRRRLFERISPKKSWEGSIGGGLLSIAASALIAHFFPFLTTLQWMGLALVVVVFGTWGDLTESLLKRHLGIKDSGNILPGHGGMLDRFDSSLMAIPASALYLYALTL